MTRGCQSPKSQSYASKYHSTAYNKIYDDYKYLLINRYEQCLSQNFRLNMVSSRSLNQRQINKLKQRSSVHSQTINNLSRLDCMGLAVSSDFVDNGTKSIDNGSPRVNFDKTAANNSNVPIKSINQANSTNSNNILTRNVNGKSSESQQDADVDNELIEQQAPTYDNTKNVLDDPSFVRAIIDLAVSQMQGESTATAFDNSNQSLDDPSIADADDVDISRAIDRPNDQSRQSNRKDTVRTDLLKLHGGKKAAPFRLTSVKPTYRSNLATDDENTEDMTFKGFHPSLTTMQSINIVYGS